MTTTANLGITLIDTNQSQKEVTANDAISGLESAVTDWATIDVNDGANTLAAADVRGNQFLLLSAGSPGLTGPIDVVLPAIKRLLVIRNESGETATISCSGAATGAEEVTLTTGTHAIVYNDGTQVWRLTNDASSMVSAFTDLSDVPANYSGAASKLLAVNSGATAVEFVAAPYDVGTFCAGKPSASEVLLRFVATRAFTLPASLTGSQVKAGTAATATTDFDLQKNGSSIGTVSFAASGTVATFTFASGVSFAAGDILAIIAPASADATLADISFTLAGTRT